MKILFSNLTPAFFFLLLSLSVGAVDHFYESCRVPKSCGNQSINFPFFIEGHQEHYCGYPGFNISCDNNGRSILHLSGQNYVVRQIFYSNQSILVSNAAFSDLDEDDCIPSLQNLTLSTDFTLPENQKRFVLLYNCQSSSSAVNTTLPNYRIGCDAENYTNSVLAYYENKDEDESVNVSRVCGRESVVAVTTEAANENEGMVTREVLRSGFILNWIASNCSLCESTGGRCGFDWTPHHFKCYCPDRPHSARCYPPGQSSSQPLLLFIYLLFLRKWYKFICIALAYLV